MGSNARARMAARRRRRRTLVAAAVTTSLAVTLVIVLLVVSGQLGDRDEPANRSVDSTPESVGMAFPDFALTSPDGQQISKASLAGKKSIIWFVDEWTCASCAPGAVQVSKLDDETGGDAFNVLAVFVTGSQKPSDLDGWRNRYARPDWLVATDTGNRLASSVKLPCLDSKFLLDESGIILDVHTQVTDSGYVSMLRSEVRH
ncbi:TlpA disulfide reductase family protein [Dactylosporangium sp. CA-092794]|uniref:TlpA disulfide reductase family protein n=1 Tax=Dactylosporangium sp. CA-092794 TaxID=3239929 RepID=UPI003D8F25A3